MNLSEHKEHIVSLGTYLMAGTVLLLLTGVTVMVAQADLGSWSIVVALAIASLKASVVILIFMHLRWANRLYAMIFVLAVLFLAVFIVFTMFDTANRAAINRVTEGPIRPMAIIYDAEGKPIPLASRLFEQAEGQVAGAGAESDVPFEMLHGYGPIKEEIKVGPLDTVMALKGLPIFETKCATRHRLDERYTGPPLRGVTIYRSPTFIMNQILDPAQNVTNHPDMQAMLAQYYTYMTNQNVTRDQARILVEYLRWEAGRGGPPTQAG